MKKTLIIFANSIKHKNSCIAGKDIETKKWIRLVGNENGCALNREDSIQPLQKFTIKFSKKAPLINQPENYIVSNEPWKLEGQIEREEIKKYLDNPNDLWIDDSLKKEIEKLENEKPKKEKNVEKIDLEQIRYKIKKEKISKKISMVNFELIKSEDIKIDQSLYLIKINKIHIYWKDRGIHSKKQRRGKFAYKNLIYDLAITDPKFKDFEEKDLFDKYLCISLGEKFYNEYSDQYECYKIIAAIL